MKSSKFFPTYVLFNAGRRDSKLCEPLRVASKRHTLDRGMGRERKEFCTVSIQSVNIQFLTPKTV